MCLSCSRFWTALQVLWSTVYVTCGAAQVLAGIFFTISVPEVHLYSVIVAGIWNIVIGISGGMVACINTVTSRRQEVLLYMAVSILTVNLVNLIVMEYCFYKVDMPKLLKIYNNHILINYACFVTRIATAVVLVVSFFDSQFAFCSMQSAKKKQRPVQHPRGLRKLRGSHEQVSDIEYIIPRPKNSKSHHTVYNAYAQSWVFDAENNASCSNNNTTSSVQQPYFKVLQQNGDTPHKKIASNHHPKQKKPSPTGNNKAALQNGMVKENGHVIDNPVVHIEEASDDSNSNSDRKLCYMKSFSRSQSPMVLSASSSQTSLNLNQSQHHPHHNPPIYEYLEKLTEPAIYRSRLNTVLSNREEESQDQYQAPQTVIMRRVESTSPRVEKVQYASLMKELQKAIVSKKEPSSITSPQSNTSDSATTSEDKTQTSKSSSRSEGTKNSDADFSKELEAALQLIQDLESPNTIETPSETKSPLDGGGQTRPLAVWRNSSDGSEGSEKTLSAVGSLAEITSPMAECQPDLYSFKPQVSSTNGASVTIHYPESQSTSGYSSPTHGPTPIWSTTSSINGSNSEIKPTSYSIHNTNSATVISLFSSPNQTKAKSITLVKITSDDTAKLPIDKDTNALDKKSISTTEVDSGVSSVNSCENNSFNSCESNSLGSKGTNSVSSNGTNSVNDYDLNNVIHAYDTATVTKNTKRSSTDEKTWSIPLHTTGWKLNSLLRRKKQSTMLPKLAPELEGAIIKSESLAYLSDLELLARHQRNQELQREIEKRVVQQLSVPRTARTESNC